MKIKNFQRKMYQEERFEEILATEGEKVLYELIKNDVDADRREKAIRFMNEEPGEQEEEENG